MLPPELLKAIFGALSRFDLDALLLTSLLSRDIVFRDFANVPIRYFATVSIDEDQSYTFVLATGNKYTCRDDDDFSRRMRFVRVGTLDLSNADMEPNVCNVLLPLKDAWRDGHIVTACNFASRTLFERVFTELFVCKSMDVITGGEYDQISRSFTWLPAVRECTYLHIVLPPYQFSVAEIRDWLNVDAVSGEPKRFESASWVTGGSVVNFIQQLMTDFIGSTRARRYVVTVRVPAYDGPSGRFVNKDTSEVLIVIHGTDGRGHYVEVERKALDDNY